MSKKTDDAKAVEKLGKARDAIVSELRKTIVGMDDVIDEMMIAIFSRGHCLLVGVPGLAKTLLVSSLAETMSLGFKRIQFTPDLMPSDITGTELLQEDPETHERRFKFQKGPVFTNLLLADEINRTPPKTQAALLEAMQEKRVSSGGEDFKLDEPFFVLATQNPIEQEGTYPLPEAQVDRFMLKIKVGYPSREEERVIMDRMISPSKRESKTVITPERLLKAREVVDQVYLDDRIKDYIVELVFGTREPASLGNGQLADHIEYGASPRASVYLAQAAKAHAFLEHRGYVIPEDIKAIGLDVLRHRVVPTYEAEAEDLTSEDLVRRVFELVEVP